ncbi:hypothetical protein B0A50_08166 [Salinomyces thailandicus]|uniref:RRM domain-containing protein n=1 Tax=Salinomyces thailandicus TaxID=706561 RepID=A0A4U0TKM8_9PEZI|nr:hypothetical protein B0A50_08166 [Salinomyces thailandica]
MSAIVSSTRNSNIGRYFFIIDGLPKKYTWQDLKDLIRREASHSIWTEMHIFPNGQPGGKGHARVQREDEARNLYRYLTTNVIEHRRLRVHLWDISGPEARFWYCNCETTPCDAAQSYSAQGMEIARMALAPGWQTIAPVTSMPINQGAYPSGYSQAPTPPSAIAASGSNSQAALIQAVTNMQLGAPDPRFQDPRLVACYQQQQQQQQQQQLYARAARSQAAISQHHQSARLPVYVLSSSGMPVNTLHGTVRIEARGVFVSGLNFKARSKEVEALFSRAGEVTKCEVQRDAATGKSKGNATIQFALAASVQKAIDLFDEKSYMNMKLTVRPDKEPSAISPPPVQANRML